jgi:chemotaxis protein MotB
MNNTITSRRASMAHFRPETTQAAQAFDREYRFDPWASATVHLKGGDHWLLSYVDILTLLLTLLVVLLILQPKPSPRQPGTPPVMPVVGAPVTPDSRIMSTEILPIQRAPGRVVSEVAPKPPPAAAGTEKEAVPLVLPEKMEIPASPPASPDLTEDTGARPAPAEVQMVEESRQQVVEREHPLLERLTAERLDDRLRITRVAEGVNLEMRENILFDPGSAELKPEGKPLLASLARVLYDGGGLISVEGHTDDRPIANSRFPSNWELATGRASAVSRFLIRQGLDATRLRAIGYASTRPLESNATPEGRARNRRVSLVVQLRKDDVDRL